MEVGFGRAETSVPRRFTSQEPGARNANPAPLIVMCVPFVPPVPWLGSALLTAGLA